MVCASEGDHPNDTDQTPLRTMQIKPFFSSKASQETKSFISYEGASKDPVTGASKVNNKIPDDPEEYPMGEWGPAEPEEYPMGEWGPAEPEEYPMGEWGPAEPEESPMSELSPVLLDPMHMSLILNYNTAPAVDDLCTTCF